MPNDSSGPPSDDRSDAPFQSARIVSGTLLAGRYEILEPIGEGGTAEVFRARDHRLDRIVAIKVLRPQYGQDADARARFEVEARSAAALAVATIVPVYDYGAADDGSLFIVMRFIDGPSLRSVLAERGALPAGETVDIGRQVAQALAAAHDHGLIHRDVKPGNILIDAMGTAHLTDFGIVKALTGADDLTRTGIAFGTAAYLSPEQATGGPVDTRTDLYALGVVLYEMLAGRPPFSADDLIAMSYKHAHETPTQLAALMPGIDPDLERIVMQCLEKRPERRPASAQAVAAALSSIGSRFASAVPAAAIAGGPAWDEADTVVRTTISPEAMAAAWSGRVAPTAPLPASAPETWSAGPVYAPPPMQAGIAPPARPIREARDRRGGAVLGTAILLLAIGLVALVGAIVVLPALLPGGDGGVANASATPRATRTQAASVPVVAPTVDLQTLTPTAEPPSQPPVDPSTAPPITAPPVTAPPVTAPPIDPPTAPPGPTPVPTAQVTPVLPPPVVGASARIEDEWFVGDYDQGSGQYHGRTASWVYGQATPYHTMTAGFQLNREGQVVGNASLEIVGLDGENPVKQNIRIVLNGVTIYEGPNPLPDDDCCGPAGPGNWGSAVFEFPGDLLARDNTLVITNLDPNDCTTCPKYVMVDYAVLAYRVQP